MTNARKLDEEVALQAQLIMIVASQRKRKVQMEANGVILRAAVGNLMNSFMNVKLGNEERLGAKPTARFMSKAFFKEWTNNPSQHNLRKVGVYEHRIPMKVLEALLYDAKNTLEVIKIIDEHALCAWITHEENARLNSANLRSDIPKSIDRYTSVGIELHPDGPVSYFKPRSKISRPGIDEDNNARRG